MSSKTISREDFLQSRLGKTFSDVAHDASQPFDEVLQFFNNEDRQRRMEESEIHHDRPALAGVVRELESQPAIERCLSGNDRVGSKRLRQAIGVLVRLIMEQRGWRKTGRKGSLGVRDASAVPKAKHNTGGLAFWFVRAERYEIESGSPFQSVKARCQELETSQTQNLDVRVPK